MKKFITSFAVILLACVCVLTGCKAKGLKDNPSTDAEVYGNGNIAVVKGDYLYYTNGYVDNYTEVYTSKKQNNWGKVTLGALYRTKLVNGKVEKDEDGFLVKTEVVVPRLVGFEYGKFVILDDYIYYSTPRMREDGDGTVKNDYIEFNRVKIDGTKNEVIYTASAQISTDNWNIYKHGKNVYLVLVNSVDSQNNLLSINTKSKSVKTIGENITSWVLPKSNTLEVVEDYDYNQYIYFTRASVESDENTTDSGNRLVKASIVSGESKDYVVKQATTKTLVGLVGTNLFFNDGKNLYAIDVTLNVFNERSMQQMTNGSYSTYYLLNESKVTCIAVDENNNAHLYVNGVKQKDLFSGSQISVVDIVGENIVYVDSDSNIMMKNYVTNAAPVSLMDDSKTYFVNNAKIDITKGKLYVFATYTGTDETSNYYLNYINLNSIGAGSFVGKFAEGHCPEKPETTTDEETGEDNTPIWIA